MASDKCLDWVPLNNHPQATHKVDRTTRSAYKDAKGGTENRFRGCRPQLPSPVPSWRTDHVGSQIIDICDIIWNQRCSHSINLCCAIVRPEKDSQSTAPASPAQVGQCYGIGRACSRHQFSENILLVHVVTPSTATKFCCFNRPLCRKMPPSMRQ